MPYVTPERRGIYVELKQVPETPGELNYLLSSIVIAYVREHGLSYAIANEVLGAFTGAQLEFYRRVVAPLEDFKSRANGDLPWPTIEEVARNAGVG